MALDRGRGGRPAFLLPRGMRIGGLRGPPLMPALRPSFASLRPPLRDLVFAAPPAKRPRASSPAPSSCDDVSLSAALSSDSADVRLEALGTERASAIELWLPLLARVGSASGVVQRMAASGEKLALESPTLVSVLAAKSVGTMRKRLTSLLLFERWCATAGFPAFPVQEATVFSYFTFLQSERAPPTRAQATREALNFLSGVFDVPLADVSASRRVAGSALLSLERKQLLRQRAPLTVSMIVALECLARADTRDGILAGLLLFCVFGRLRVGDMVQIDCEPTLDAPEVGEGFLEAFMVKHKTAKPGTRRSMPVAVPTLGISGSCWTRPWLAHRAKQGLDASRSSTLAPAPLTSGGWSEAPLRTAEVGVIIKELLLGAGFSAEELARVGAHSLKATVLSWLAKFGVDVPTRMLLGYRRSKSEQASAAYSRDELAGPLRSLVSMLSAVRDRSFAPDLSRSGRFVASPARAPSSSSSSASSSSSRSSASSSSAGSCAPPPSVIENEATHFLHHKGPDDRLLCGKPFPDRWREISEWPQRRKLCRRCFA